MGIVVPDWIWYVFIFAFGCCVGSFLNVVVFRLPRDKSLIKPPSSCPACGRGIRFYDNIPLISWLVLGRKCRYCKAPISPRYFIIELLTALVFVGVFFLYFHTELRAGIDSFVGGGWFIYLISITMLAAFIAASAIDLELWVIPLPICWFVTGVGLIGSALGVYVIESAVIRGYGLLPSASEATGAMAAGAAIGLAISWALVASGLVKVSYERNNSSDRPGAAEELSDKTGSEEPTQGGFNEAKENSNGVDHRLEVCKEIVFLLPIIVCSAAAYIISRQVGPIQSWWVDFSQKPAIAGFLGSLWGYFVGCGIVWATRILGTLGFGKEAMGLGDVHLMGAAGTILGAGLAVVAFFIAPFFGLAWAGVQMFFKKSRQIPYGPFLSLGAVTVMILHDWIFYYLNIVFYH